MIIPKERVNFLHGDVIDTDDRSQPSEAYGESGEEAFPRIYDACDCSPNGEHVYAGPGGFHCRWCRQQSGLDR